MADRFGLTQPALDDQYNISVYNGNVRIIAENALKSTAVSELKVITKEAYAALETKNEETLYIVCSSTGFSLYLGDKPMESAGYLPLSLETIRSAPLFGSVTGEETVQEE